MAYSSPSQVCSPRRAMDTANAGRSVLVTRGGGSGHDRFRLHGCKRPVPRLHHLGAPARIPSHLATAASAGPRKQESAVFPLFGNRRWSFYHSRVWMAIAVQGQEREAAGRLSATALPAVLQPAVAQPRFGPHRWRAGCPRHRPRCWASTLHQPGPPRCLPEQHIV